MSNAETDWVPPALKRASDSGRWLMLSLSTVLSSACGGEDSRSAPSKPSTGSAAAPEEQGAPPQQSPSPAATPEPQSGFVASTPSTTSEVNAGSDPEPANPGQGSLEGDADQSGETLLPVPPGAPVTLMDGLVFPSRLSADEEQIYVNNRVRVALRDAMTEGRFDEVLAQPFGETTPPRIALRLNSVEDIEVVDSSLWVANGAEGFMRYDVRTGALLQQFSAAPLYPMSIASNDTSMFLAWSEGSIERVPRLGSTREVLLETGSGYPFWVSASDTHLVAVMVPSTPALGQLLSIELASKVTTILVEGDHRIGSTAIVNDDVLFTDWTDGGLKRVASSGGSATVVATLAQPWGLAIEGDYAYVSTQPELCSTGTEGTVERVSLKDGSRTSLASGLPCPSMLLTTSAGLYWVNNGLGEYDESLPGNRPVPHTGSLMFLPR